MKYQIQCVMRLLVLCKAKFVFLNSNKPNMACSGKNAPFSFIFNEVFFCRCSRRREKNVSISTSVLEVQLFGCFCLCPAAAETIMSPGLWIQTRTQRVMRLSVTHSVRTPTRTASSQLSATQRVILC